MHLIRDSQIFGAVRCAILCLLKNYAAVKIAKKYLHLGKKAQNNNGQETLCTKNSVKTSLYVAALNEMENRNEHFAKTSMAVAESHKYLADRTSNKTWCRMSQS